MSLQLRISALATAMGTDVKTLTAAIGSLASLTTTQKASLVGAINELKTQMAGLTTNQINDALTSGAANTYSIDKILAVVAQTKADLLGGVPQANWDTLKEISDYISGDQTATSGLVTAMGRRVSVDVQTFTAPEQAQARANIGALSTTEIGNPETDLVAAYTAAKA